MAAEVAVLLEVDDLPNAEVLVATTWQCNLRCSYCFVKDQTLKEHRPRMSAATARRLIDTLDVGMRHVESICVHLYGGEPLTNMPALKAMVERAEQKHAGRFTFAITTNGTLMSDKIIEMLDRGRFQVILSIDGPPQVHNACRRSVGAAPTHHKVMAFLDAVKSRTRCWVRGSAVVRRGWRLRDAELYLRSLPVDSIKAQAVRVSASDPFALSATEKQDYLHDLDEVGSLVISDLEAGRRPVDDRFANRVLQILKGDVRDSFCGAGNTTFGFMPDGSVTPCVLLEGEDQGLGHIDDDPDTWITAGSRWKKTNGVRKDCLDCPAKPLCGGGCPAILPICGANECDIIRKNCDVARGIYRHFAERPEMLLPLAGLA